MQILLYVVGVILFTLGGGAALHRGWAVAAALDSWAVAVALLAYVWPGLAALPR